jgi:two-component system, sensor histidine kinase and response regulator
MGGRIWVESVVGRGSQFCFTIKVSGAETGARREGAQALELKGLRVLIVDGDEANRKFLSLLLRRRGILPVAAGTLEEAARIYGDLRAKSERLSAVLLSGGDELGAARAAVRQLAAATKEPLPIVLLLPSPLEAKSSEDWKEAGAVRVLLTPLRRAALLDTLQRATGHPIVEVPGAKSSEAAPQAMRKFRILVAEDNPVNQTLMARMLEKMGHTVVVANDGQSALEKLTSAEFDLVAMDMQMPVMDGLAATRAIRQWEAGTGRHVAIVAMTANAMEQDRQRCMDSGMDGYVAKPVTPTAVRKEIERAMQVAEEAEKRVTVP